MTEAIKKLEDIQEQFTWIRRRVARISGRELDCLRNFFSVADGLARTAKILDEIHDAAMGAVTGRIADAKVVLIPLVEDAKKTISKVEENLDNTRRACKGTRIFYLVQYAITYNDVEGVKFGVNYIAKLVEGELDKSTLLNIASTAEDYIVRIVEILDEALEVLVGVSTYKLRGSG